jgi:hypothetical protein
MQVFCKTSKMTIIPILVMLVLITQESFSPAYSYYFSSYKQLNILWENLDTYPTHPQTFTLALTTIVDSCPNQHPYLSVGHLLYRQLNVPFSVCIYSSYVVPSISLSISHLFILFSMRIQAHEFLFTQWGRIYN